jgi:hypothetical protein
MIYKLEYKNLRSIIIFLSWLFLFGTINVYPEDLLNIKSFHEIIKAGRIIVPMTISFLIFILLLIQIFKKKKIFYIPDYLSIFFFIFLFQLIGALLSGRVNFETLYVILFSFLLIILFIFIEYSKIQKTYFFFLYSLIFFILISCIILFILKFNEFIIGIKILNLYSTFHPDLSLIGYSPPRSTGYSRMLVILSLFLIIWFENKKETFKNYFFYLILFLGFLIWIFQSRGSYLCYTLSVVFILFIINYKSNLYIKLLKAFLYVFGPIIITYILSSGINSINIYDSKLNIESRDVIILNESAPEIEKNVFNENRILNQTTTSGRVDLWSKSLNKYNKEKIFGYGPQADRLILQESNASYGNNVSNGLIYTFLSGGYFSALLYIILYIKIFFYILKYIKKFKNKIHLPTQLAFVYMIFFSIRSLFENSYAIWGIDYMFLLVSIGILDYQVTNKKKYEGFNINNLLK